LLDKRRATRCDAESHVVTRKLGSRELPSHPFLTRLHLILRLRIPSFQVYRKVRKNREYVLDVQARKALKGSFDQWNMKIWLCCGVYWEVHSPFGKPKRPEAADQQLFAVPREGDTKTQYAPPRVSHR